MKKNSLQIDRKLIARKRAETRLKIYGIMSISIALIMLSTLIISIYSSLTIACAFIYWAQGMNIFDSIAHSFTTLATGGFSTHNESIGYFNNPGIEITATVFIILGCLLYTSPSPRDATLSRMPSSA